MAQQPIFDPSLDPTAIADDDLDSIDDESAFRKTRPTGTVVKRPMGVEGLGIARLSTGSSDLTAEEQQVESDLRARLNELLVLTKEGTVDAVVGLGGLLTRESDPAQPGGGLQAGEERVRAHRQSVYGLTREPPPWSVKPGAPTTSAKISSFTQKMGLIGKSKKLTAEDVVGGRQLHSKVAIVTGGNSGLGYETARVLCKAGARVILACRNVKAAEAACDKIRFELEGAAAAAVEIVHDSEWVGANYSDIGTVEVMELDLADLESVRSFAAKFIEEECPLHYLICNAGKMAPPYRRTAQGYETQWAVNHLGHFLLAALLTEKLDETAGRTEDGSRLVVLTSQSHQLGKMHWDEGFLNAQKDYDPWAAYFQSKLANVLFVREFDRLSARRSAEKHGEDGTWPRTTAHAVNPGLTPTGITRELSSIAKAAYFGGVVRRSVAVGAATTLYCCVGKAHDLVMGGRYYENCEEVQLWDDFEEDEAAGVDGAGGDGTAAADDDEDGESELDPDDTSLESAARLWALSEWMVQPNSTYHDAHNGLFDVEEEAEQQAEAFEKVFNYEVVPDEKGGGAASDQSNAFGEAAGEWEEAQFDPTAAQLAAAQAAAARKLPAGRRGGGSRSRQQKQQAQDDGVELAVLSPAEAAGGTPRRAAVHTPVIEAIDPLVRRPTTTAAATTTTTIANSSADGSPTAANEPEPEPSSDDEQSPVAAATSAGSAAASASVGALAPSPGEAAALDAATTQQRMAWLALAHEERAAAILLGWDRDGLRWEQGEPPVWQQSEESGDGGGAGEGGTGASSAAQGDDASDSGAVLASTSAREWRKLSAAEQAAGATLGYDQASWDKEMAPEVAEAKAKAKAAADEAAELAMLARAAKVDAELARESRRVEAAQKEKERAERKAKVAAAKAQRKAQKDAEEKEKLAADAVRQVKEQQEAEKAKADAKAKAQAQILAAATAAQPADEAEDNGEVDAAAAKAAKKAAANRKKKARQKAKKAAAAQHQAVDVDQAEAEAEERDEKQDGDSRKSPSPEKADGGGGGGGSATAPDGGDDAEAAAAAVEAALDAQAKAAFAALAAAAAAGPNATAPPGTPGGGGGGGGSPLGTPGQPGSPLAGMTSPGTAADGSPADEKKQAVVAAKADYFFGQAMRLHNEFAAIEGRSGARKLSYFEASGLAEDLGLSLSGPDLNAALPKLDPARSGEIRFADFEEWWKAAALQAGKGGKGSGSGSAKAAGGSAGGANSGASKNSLGSAIALALAEEGGFVE